MSEGMTSYINDNNSDKLSFCAIPSYSPLSITHLGGFLFSTHTLLSGIPSKGFEDITISLLRYICI